MQQMWTLQAELPPTQAKPQKDQEKSNAKNLER